MKNINEKLTGGALQSGPRQRRWGKNSGVRGRNSRAAHFNPVRELSGAFLKRGEGEKREKGQDGKAASTHGAGTAAVSTALIVVHCW
jgi:hypothetical protein